MFPSSQINKKTPQSMVQFIMPNLLKLQSFISQNVLQTHRNYGTPIHENTRRKPLSPGIHFFVKIAKLMVTNW